MIHQSNPVMRDNIALSLTTWGATPPDVVFIHGFADGRYLWSPFAASCIEHGGALAMDLRGHGDSEWDPSGVYGIAKHVDDVQVILDRFCASKLILVGHSMGAEIALRIAATNKDRIRALMMIDWIPGLTATSLAQMRSIFQLRMRPFDSRQQYLDLLSEWMPLSDEAMRSLAVEHAIVQADNCYRQKIDPKLLDMPLSGAAEELWPLFESLTCERLLLRGEASGLLSRRTMTDMAHRIAGLRCETISMAGHAVMMDNPKDFDSILRRFVNDARNKAVDTRHSFATESLAAA
jgi:pimeloyl-ACP methyl ester carboxylesterase